MSVFSTSITHRSFYWQITVVCFVLGLLLAAAWHTALQATRSGTAPVRTGFIYGTGTQVAPEKAHQYENEIQKLRADNTALENRLAGGKDAAKVLNQTLQDTKLLAGLTEAVGPGVQVTLTDSRKTNPFQSEQLRLISIIHDRDIATVVHELNASGAEAIAVNGQRVVAATSIRCVGPVVQVNGVPITPPYTIQAIGNPDTMYGGLNLPGGVLEDLRRYDPNMARVERKPRLLLPAFSGSTQMRYAHPLENSGKDGYAKETK